MRVELEGTQLAQVELKPVWVKHGQPQPSSDARLVQRLRQICSSTGTQLTEASDGWLRVQSR